MKLKSILSELNSAENQYIVGSTTYYFPLDLSESNVFNIINKISKLAISMGALDVKYTRNFKLTYYKDSKYLEFAVLFAKSDIEHYRNFRKKHTNIWRTLEKTLGFFHTGLKNLSFLYKSYDLNSIKKQNNGRAIKLLTPPS